MLRRGLLALLLLLLAAAPHPARGGYSFERDGVLAAGQKSFEDIVVYSGQLTLVLFFSPSCPHCVRLEPEFKRAAKLLKEEGIKAVAVDAVQERGLADYYNVSGYPTVKLFVPAEQATSHAGKEATAVDVTGVGGPNALTNAACEQKRLLLERARRARPEGGSKIVPELDSVEAARSLATLSHPTTLSARAAVLFLADSDEGSGVCRLAADAAAPEWLATAALKFKQGREKAVSFGAVPSSLSEAVADELGLAPPKEGPAIWSGGRLLFVRAKGRAGRVAGVSEYEGSLEISAKQKKTALLKAVRGFVERGVRGELATVLPLPEGMVLPPDKEEEAGAAKVAAGPVELSPTLDPTPSVQ